MRKRIAFVAFLVCAVASLRAEVQPCSGPEADWTVMVYLNGDNSLEPEIFNDALELAKIGSTDRVNVVAQIDRLKTIPLNLRGQLSDPEWSDTYRFLIQKDQDITPLYAVKAMGEVNMVSGAALTSFVQWAMCGYRARHYALILSSHGNGARNFDGAPPTFTVPNAVSGAPSRAITSDEHTGGNDLLYMGEISQALRDALPAGKKIDVLGFDACLMGMIEVAYALRDYAGVLVASEDLEPGAGWNHERWLGKLTAKPSSEPRDVARFIVDGFKDEMAKQEDDSRTLSAIDLSKIDVVTSRLSVLSRTLMSASKEDRKLVAEARNACFYYAPKECGYDCFFNIDLRKFTDELAARSNNALIKQQASDVSNAVKAANIGNPYAGAARAGGGFGSNGMAIYFPKVKGEYDDDKLMETAYVRGSDVVFPIAFVEDPAVAWAPFLASYFATNNAGVAP